MVGLVNAPWRAGKGSTRWWIRNWWWWRLRLLIDKAAGGRGCTKEGYRTAPGSPHTHKFSRRLHWGRVASEHPGPCECAKKLRCRRARWEARVDPRERNGETRILANPGEVIGWLYTGWIAGRRGVDVCHAAPQRPTMCNIAEVSHPIIVHHHHLHHLQRRWMRRSPFTLSSGGRKHCCTVLHWHLNCWRVLDDHHRRYPTFMSWWICAYKGPWELPELKNDCSL